MSIQNQFTQKIGFALGSNATAPEYVFPARVFSHSPEDIYQEVRATLGSPDNLYSKKRVGRSSLPVNVTVPVTDTIAPVLFAMFGAVNTTGTAPFVNTISPNTTDGIDFKPVTLFFYDGAIGLKKQSAKILSSINCTIEGEQINLELEFFGGKEEILTSSDFTTADDAFGVTNLGYVFTPADVTIEYDTDTTFGSSTVLENVQFGWNFNISHNVEEVTRTLSSLTEMVSPKAYRGNLSAGFEFTEDVSGTDLNEKYRNNVDTAFKVVIAETQINASTGAKTVNNDNKIEVVFAPTVFAITPGDKTADSNEPLAQTVMLEQAKNNITDDGVNVIVTGSTDLSALTF